jgi:glutaredoxin
MPFIQIYTKENCVACNNAKRMLNEKQLSFSEIVVGRDVTREEVRAKFPQAKMVPIILVDGVEVKEVEQFQMLLG